MNRTRWFFILLLISLLAAPLPAAAENPPTRLKVAVLRNFPPQYATGPDGRPQGFAVDTIEAIAELAGFDVEYVPKENWAEMFAAVKSGEVDLIPNQGITDRRRQWFAFSQPVETFPVSIFTRSDTEDIDGIATLTGKRVAVVRLNIGEVLMKEQPQARTETFEHVQDALFALLSGNADALIFPAPVLRKLAMDAGIADRIQVVGAPLTEVRRGISVGKDSTALLRRIDAAVAQLLQSEAYREIYTRWYGAPAPYWSTRRVAWTMAALLAGAVLLMGLWRYQSTLRLNRELREQIQRRELAERQLRQWYETLEEKVEERTRDLQGALSQVKTLRGLLPICAHCKKIRDDQGYWSRIETYIGKHSEAEFSHGICPECRRKYYSDLDREKESEAE